MGEIARPMLRQVHIKNYKSLASVVVDLEPFTILVGPNGSGKSNFVDALRFVKECLTSSVELALRDRGGMRTVLGLSEEPPPHLGVRLMLGLREGGSADFSFEVAALPKGGFHVRREKCIVQPPAGETYEYSVESGTFRTGVEGIRPRVGSDRLALPVVAGVKEFRPVHDFLAGMQFYSVSLDRIREVQEADAGEVLKRDGSNAAAVLREISERKPDTYERLCELLSVVVPGIRRVYHATVGEREAIDFWQDVGKPISHIFNAFSMSDGTLRVLGILLAVYQVSSPSLIAIEEPEDTIHPAALEVVMDVLRDGAHRAQVLVTTHSPDLLDDKELQDGQIRLVTMDRGETRVSPLGPISRDVIRKHLYTAGELLRMDELEPDI